METAIELAIGAILFALLFRALVGQWPWLWKTGKD
jgi:hypothetical protein